MSTPFTASEDRYQKMKYRRCGESGILLPLLPSGFGTTSEMQMILKIHDTCSGQPLITALPILTWPIITDLLTGQPKRISARYFGRILNNTVMN